MTPNAEDLVSKLPRWLRWAAPVLAVLVAFLGGVFWFVLKQRDELQDLEDLGGLDGHHLAELEAGEVEELEAELLEADAELEAAITEDDLDARSDAIADLLK